MSKPLNHNQIPFETIEKYVLGKMSSVEKNAFEKQALNDPFLQDAIDGYVDNKQGLNYFNNHLKSKYKSSSNFKNYLLMAVALVTLIGGTLLWKHNKETNSIKIATNSQNNNKIIKNQNEFEVLPIEFDTLKNIKSSEQIKQKEIVTSQNEREAFKEEIQNTNTNQIIDLIDVDEIDDEDENIQPYSNETVKVYPFTYFYDLAVVDYTKYENRTQTITKSTYVLTGVDANFENDVDKKSSELTEIKVDVPYMEYLEKSMYYFSKGKYKNALKRFTIINQQYSNDLNALFYGGLANFNLGRFDKALEDFSNIINLNDNPFYEDALWYRAKTYLKLGNSSQAKSDLESLSLKSKYYQKQALNKLKEIK